MSTSRGPEIIGTNQILATLSPYEYPFLFSSLQSVHLSRSKILYDAGDSMPYCFFILSGMVSLLAVTEDGSATEISMVGNEGMLGIPAIRESTK
jgi:CRP-like cAMP-binding protein